jgi:hypothetical protein
LAQEDDSVTLGATENRREVVCPSDKITHSIIIDSLAICYNIIQFLPSIKKSKEFSGALINRMKTAESEQASSNEEIRNEFKSVFKRATDEYKQRRSWDETIKLVSQLSFARFIYHFHSWERGLQRTTTSRSIESTWHLTRLSWS